MSALIPDGYFVEDHVVWGDLGRGGIISRGYRIQFPDNSASDDDAFIELEDNIRKVLSACQKDERLQLQFYTSSDYQGPLARYEEDPRVAVIHRHAPRARTGKSDVLNECMEHTMRLLHSSHPVLGGLDPTQVVAGIVVSVREGLRRAAGRRYTL